MPHLPGDLWYCRSDWSVVPPMVWLEVLINLPPHQILCLPPVYPCVTNKCNEILVWTQNKQVLYDNLGYCDGTFTVFN